MSKNRNANTNQSAKAPTQRNGKKKTFPRKRDMGSTSTTDRNQTAAKQNSSGSYANRGPLKGLNDFSWYNRNPLLTQAAASLPFPYRPGMKLEPVMFDPTASIPATVTTPYVIPGILRMQWLPTVGQSATATDPASIAAKEVFAKVRSVFSGSIEADPPDFIIYLLALDSIFSYIGSLKRIYRILDAYTGMNYQIPDALLYALGIDDPNPWRADKAKLWQNINELIGMTRKFRCPAVFDIFNRHYWMNDNVYTDDASANSQLFVFHQAAYYKFGLSGDPKVGSLSLVTPNFDSPDTAFTFGRSLIDALASGDDAYIISGYLTRAFEATPNFVVDELQSFEEFMPVYAPEVLSQIENSMTVDADPIDLLASNAISQNPGTNAILCAPKIASTDVRLYTNRPMLSIRSDSPSVIDVVEASRLTAFVSNEAGSGQQTIECATELPCRWQQVSYESETGIGRIVTIDQLQHFTYSNSGALSVGNIQTFFKAASALSATDWSPRITYFTVDITNTSSQVINAVCTLWDVHNVTQCTPEQLAQIHRVCLLSEFNSFGEF